MSFLQDNFKGRASLAYEETANLERIEVLERTSGFYTPNLEPGSR